MDYIFAKLLKALPFTDKSEKDRVIQPKVGSVQVIWIEDEHEDEFVSAIKSYPLAPSAQSEEETCWMRYSVLSESGSGSWNSHIKFTTAEFVEYFEPLLEEGEAEYDRYTRELGQEFKAQNQALEEKTDINKISRLMAGPSKPALENKTKHLGNGAEENEPTEQPEQTGLLAPETRQSAGDIRNNIHGHKREIAAAQEGIRKLKGEVAHRVEEKMELLKHMQADVQQYLTKLTNALTTVNLYLGRDEEITVIRHGERASEDTPITIRQLVLHMDEEMAIAFPEGIDAKTIQSFDDWVIQGDNIDNIIPEKKGVIVLKPRRYEKHYDDNAMVNAIANKNNFKSYWLLRNGENLYRIYTGLEMGEVLIPRRNDLNDMFFTRNRNGEKEPLRPGSQEYYNAMDKADAAALKSMQTALMLQGILDRTLVFAPYPDQTVPNLLDPRTFGETVRILRDAEDSLTDGWPTYKEWISEKNELLAAGDRVVGNFTSNPEDRGRRDDGCRVTPKYANGYDSDFIRTLVKDKNGLKFLFERTDTVYRRGYFGGYSSGDAKTRGSYRIYKRDTFVLNIDAITIEEIEHFLHDRRSRQDYANMIPTLLKAKSLKQKEEEAERPFIELLHRELKAIEDPKLPVTNELLGDLILDWKTRNKARETLLEKESLAYQDILRTYERLSKTRKTAKPEALEAFITQHTGNPHVLRITASLDGTLRVIRRSREKSVFVDILETKPDRNGNLPALAEVKTWAPKKDAHVRRSQVIYETEEFRKLSERPSPSQIPGEFRDDAVKALQADATTCNERRSAREEPPLVLVAVTRDGDMYSGFFFETEKKRKRHECKVIERRLEQKKDNVVSSLPSTGVSHSLGRVHSFWAGNYTLTYLPPKKKADKEKDYLETQFIIPEEHGPFIHKWAWRPDQVDELLFFDPKAFSLLEKQLQVQIREEKKEERIRNAVGRKVDIIEATALAAWTEKEIRIYQEQGGAMEFWEDHLKTLRPPEHRKSHDKLWNIVYGIANKYGSDHLPNIDTLREILREGDQLEPKHSDSDWMGFRPDIPDACKAVRRSPELVEILDKKLVIPEKKPTDD